jgi:hypothetical protein
VHGRALPNPNPSATRVLVIACGALVRELRVVLSQVADSDPAKSVEVVWLPAPLHNRPERIADAVRAAIDERRGTYDRLLLGYGDCGTGGSLDALCDEVGAVRLPGPHCYSFFAGATVFDALHERELGTFYLTDFLARNFDALVMGGLGLDRHPELRDVYFGHYTRLVLLRQSTDIEVTALGRRAAAQLGLAFDEVVTGLDPLRGTVVSLVLDEPARSEAPHTATAASTSFPSPAPHPSPTSFAPVSAAAPVV